MTDKTRNNKEDTPEDLDLCKFPRQNTTFSSIEMRTLGAQASLLKIVKSLSNDFRIPDFSEEVLLSAVPYIKNNIDYYCKENWHTRPQHYFKAPSVFPLVCESEPVPLFDGEVRDITFKTKYEPVVPQYLETYTSRPHAKSVRAKHWAHTSQKPLGCIFAVHGWMLGDEKASALTLVPGYFYRMGLDVIVVELPLHGSRSTQGVTPLDIFPSIDPLITQESFAQSIFELRELREWMHKTISCPTIGLGLSLGAHVISLWASLDRLDAAICVSPLIDIARFVWNSIQGTPLEQMLLSAGYDVKKLSQAFLVSSPLAYPPKLKAEDAFIVAAKNDAIVPSEHAKSLCMHWNNPEMLWLADGHIEQLVTPTTGEAIHTFLRSKGLAHNALSDPRLYGKKKF